ncbi:unnamed protein product, partial [Scytosiphon promiscuus]
STTPASTARRVSSRLTGAAAAATAAAAAAASAAASDSDSEEEADEDGDGEEEEEEGEGESEVKGPTEEPSDGSFCHLCKRSKTDPAVSKEGAIMGPYPGGLNRSKLPRQLWVHEKCALYCPEVNKKGRQWENLSKAVRRGSALHCFSCDKKGATVGCFNGRCRHVYHVPCARSHAKWEFEKANRGKNFYCLMHQEGRSEAEIAAAKEMYDRRKAEMADKKRVGGGRRSKGRPRSGPRSGKG